MSLWVLISGKNLKFALPTPPQEGGKPKAFSVIYT